MIPKLAMPLLTVALTVVLTAGASARAAGHDDLISAVPAQAALVVAVDHAKLSTHPHYGDIVKLLEDQGWAAGLSADPTSPLAPGKAVLRTVTFRMANDAEGAILAGKFELAAVEAHYKGALGAGFETGEVEGRRWFSIGKGMRAVDVGGGRLALVDKSVATKVAELAAGKGKAMSTRGDYKTLAKQASKGAPPVWGVVFVPSRTKKQLEAKGSDDIAQADKLTFQVVGSGDMTVGLVAHTKDEAAAQKLADGVNGKIERKILGSNALRLLGVTALAEQAKMIVKGKTAVGSVKLTTAQVGLLSRVLGKVLVALK